MAEAVVEERPPVQPRYYCHKCNREISISNAEFICPLCANGFVEELPPSAPANNGRASNTSSAPNSGGGQRHNQAGLHFLNDFQRFSSLLRSGGNGPSFEITVNPNNRSTFFQPIGTTTSTASSGGGNNAGGNGTSGNNGPSGSTGGVRLRGRNLDRFDNVLIDFLQNLTNGELDGNLDNPRLLYMGNFGDYAWGLEGIDTIVTQLLNQMETAGPPPMAKDKIKELPTIEVGEEEIEQKLQCSVCWEDFQLKEPVRKLPCAHLYHESCIVPWLELHGTCPICRKLLVDENELGGGGGGGSNETNNQSQAADERMEEVATRLGIPATNLQAALNRNRNSTLFGNIGAVTTAAPAIASSGQQQANNSNASIPTANVNPTNVPAATATSQNSNPQSSQPNNRPTQENNHVFSFDNSNMDLD